MRRCHLDSFRAILAANSLPKSVVTVQNYHLVRRALKARKSSEHGRPDRRVARRCVGDMTQLVAVWIVVVSYGITPQDRSRVYWIHVRERASPRQQFRFS